MFPVLIHVLILDFTHVSNILSRNASISFTEEFNCYCGGKPCDICVCMCTLLIAKGQDTHWPKPNVLTAVGKELYSELTQQRRQEQTNTVWLFLQKSIFVHRNLFLKGQLRPGAGSADTTVKMCFFFLPPRPCCLCWTKSSMDTFRQPGFDSVDQFPPIVVRLL